MAASNILHTYTSHCATKGHVCLNFFIVVRRCQRLGCINERCLAGSICIGVAVTESQADRLQRTACGDFFDDRRDLALPDFGSFPGLRSTGRVPARA